jgi:DNA-binding CsgD family transcriptional regulator
MPAYGPVLLAAWRGREAVASAVIAASVPEASARGEGAVLAFADYARAVLYNGLGRYDEALRAASATDAFGVEGFVIYTQGLIELVEAAARAGAPERARDALGRLSDMAIATGTDWGAGIRARSAALLSVDGKAEPLYREAIERLGRSRIRPQLARAHLLYGEWLRRQNRRVDARTQLRIAYQMLSAMGVESFAERARRELLATGETVRKRSAKTAIELTAQEAHIARLAVAGHTNPEIGAQLFISARTVEWHLRKVFTKLDVGSRRELRGALRHLAPVDVTA